MSEQNPLKTLNLIPLRDVPGVLSKCGLKSANGNPIHVSTVYRWATRGLGGRHLATMKIGKARVTTTDDLILFFGTIDSSLAQDKATTVSRLQKHHSRRADREARRILGLPPQQGGRPS